MLSVLVLWDRGSQYKNPARYQNFNKRIIGLLFDSPSDLNPVKAEIASSNLVGVAIRSDKNKRRGESGHNQGRKNDVLYDYKGYTFQD